MNSSSRGMIESARTHCGRHGWLLVLAALWLTTPIATAQSLGRPEEVGAASPIPQSVPRAEPRAGGLQEVGGSPAPVSLPGDEEPAEELSFWGRMYRRMNPWASNTTGQSSTLTTETSSSLWSRTQRLFGMGKGDQPAAMMVRGSNGQWQALPADRATDRYSNPDFLAAEDLFRKEDYSGAAKAFKKLAKSYKDRPLEEDILFMLAECEFKLDRLPSAQDSYHKLLTKYPTTRYMPQAVQRSYDIAYFWLEDSRLRAEGKARKYTWSRYINFFDKTRPLFDTDGRALDTVEVIQQYDPFGPLTDDAMMMAGADRFISDDYVQAAGFYEQLVTDQPQSEHTGKAKILCEQSYLRSYRGPQYDGSDLDGAYRMAKAALETREMYSPDQQRRLEADVRAIYLERAKRDYTMGEDFRKRWLYTSAKYYYGLVTKQYPDTDWARLADERLQELGEKETKHLKLDDWVRWPFSGDRSARLATNPFQAPRSESINDIPADAGMAEEAEEGLTPDSNEGEQVPAPTEKKKSFNLRNWLDQL